MYKIKMTGAYPYSVSSVSYADYEEMSYLQTKHN